MIKKILGFVFIILVMWFFIENPMIFKEFTKFSGDRIKNTISGNTVADLRDNADLKVSAGVEANLTIT